MENVGVKNKLSTIEKWNNIYNGLTKEQCEELEYLSKISSDMEKIDIDSASETLIKCMEQYNINLDDNETKRIIDKINEIRN